MRSKFAPIVEKYRLLFSASVLGLLLLAAVLISWGQRVTASGYVLIGDDLKVAVEVASTVKTRERGLSGRSGLGPDQGMLFVFLKSDTYSFWMKDMEFPIDILWINGQELVDITTDVQVPSPGEEMPTYFPRSPVDKVLEVPAGYARTHGLRTGMTVVTHIDSNRTVR